MFSDHQKIKLLRKSTKTKDVKISEMKMLQSALFEYGLSLDNQYPGTYFGMILSKMQSKNPNSSYMYFDDIDETGQWFTGINKILKELKLIAKFICYEIQKQR